MHITAHNPWFALHYATTGLNNITSAANPAGQQISRQQAMHMFARGAAWFCNREDDLGQITEGYLADLVVLDKDYSRVSDAEMRTSARSSPWSRGKSYTTPACSTIAGITASTTTMTTTIDTGLGLGLALHLDD